jgi:hypothetical protein
VRPDSKTCADPILRRVGAVATLALAAPILAGCYAYVPTDLASVHPGMEVRADISADAAQRLAPVLNSGARTIAGSIALVDPDGLMLLVPVAVRRQAAGVQIIRRRVSILREEITQLRRRALDRTRTAVLVGVGVLAVGAVVYASTSGGGDPANHPMPLANRISGIALRLILPLTWVGPHSNVAAP